jgi:heme a synthase
VGMLIIQVLLGGITRLTGSGLSITQWDVITGVIPPLTEAQWVQEFSKYQQSPQFLYLNFHFTISDFKFIFFWEWFHRLWARLIGLVFLVGFFWLMKKNYLKKEMIKPLLILFLLGALQGAVGWIMVASGLTGDAIYVRPAKLALHFIFAMVLVVAAFWFGLKLVVKDNQKLQNSSLRFLTDSLIVLLFIQLIFGALMAGHKAATAAPTWPDINGSFIPDSIFRFSPWMMNFIENTQMIHFIHRNLGYVLVLLTVIWTWQALKNTFSSTLFRKSVYYPVFLVLIQVLLGISTVLTSIKIVPGQWAIFEWMAQLHQLVAMLFLLSLIFMAYLIKYKRAY